MEQWKEIEEFPAYEVSDKGRIRNAKTGRILKTHIDSRGRERLTLRKDNRQHTKKVHRLVANAFCEQYYEGLDVMHIDGDSTNNEASNLEWRFGWDIAKRSGRKRGKVTSKKPVPPARPTKRILCLETGTVYESIEQASELTGINRYTISRIINARSFCSKEGYHFIWVD